MKVENVLTVARYLEGDMELQEKLQFEKKIEQDEMLRRDIDEYRQIHQTLKMNIAPDEQDRHLAATLNGLSKKYFVENPSVETGFKPEARVVSLKPYIKYISIAAILVIGLLVWAPWAGGLYKQYRISTEMSVAERGSAGKNRIAEGAAFYNKGDYEEAKKVLQNEYMLNPRNPLLAYYFAIVLIENGKEAEARTILVNLYQGESVFKIDAAYYVALSFVKEGKHSEAVQWLKKIPQSNVNYHKATELIGKLK